MTHIRREGEILRRLAAALCIGLVGLVSACANLPSDGPIERVGIDPGQASARVPYFKPPGPTRDAPPQGVVNGFLLAMTANPVSTSVARQFLSEQAAAKWQPRRVVVYDEAGVRNVAGGVEIALRGVHQLDETGAWAGSRGRRVVTMRMVNEGGQWRIDNPGTNLVIPATFFEAAYQRFNTYYIDQAAQRLIPSTVFLPSGDQLATDLVRSLFAGPGPAIRDIAQTALPEALSLRLSVINETGVAELPVSQQILDLAPDQMELAAAQVAQTLGQLSAIREFRFTVDGSPVRVPDQAGAVSVRYGADLRGSRSPSVELLGWNGRAVSLQSGTTPIQGAFGGFGFKIRSIAASEQTSRVAVVAESGAQLFVAKNEAESQAREVLRGKNLLRPSYDEGGNLWVVDATSRGAVVWAITAKKARRVEVPGVSGAEISAFSVAPDGTRIAFASAKKPGGVLVFGVARGNSGAPTGVARPARFSVPEVKEAVVDLGWRNESTLAVLTHPADSGSMVSFISSDGSPADAGLGGPALYPVPAQQLVVSSHEASDLSLLVPQRTLVAWKPGSSWREVARGVRAATYAR